MPPLERKREGGEAGGAPPALPAHSKEHAGGKLINHNSAEMRSEPGWGAASLSGCDNGIHQGSFFPVDSPVPSLPGRSSSVFMAPQFQSSRVPHSGLSALTAH